MHFFEYNSFHARQQNPIVKEMHRCAERPAPVRFSLHDSRNRLGMKCSDMGKDLRLSACRCVIFCRCGRVILRAASGIRCRCVSRSGWCPDRLPAVSCAGTSCRRAGRRYRSRPRRPICDRSDRSGSGPCRCGRREASGVCTRWRSDGPLFRLR